jgi:hypothetical protein
MYAPAGAETGVTRLQREQAGIAPSTSLRAGSGRAEMDIYFRCFGGFAAKTTEKDSHFLAAAGEKAFAVATASHGPGTGPSCAT